MPQRVWMDSVAPANGVQWTMIEGNGRRVQAEYEAAYRIGGDGGGNLMASADSNKRATDCSAHSQTPIPVQQWACVEWYFATSKNSMPHRIEGKLVEDLNVNGAYGTCTTPQTGGKWMAPDVFEKLYFGLERYSVAVRELSILTTWY